MVDCRSTSFMVKVIGTIISITGAVMVGLYKGRPDPIVRNTSSSSQPLKLHKLLIFTSSTEHWLLGCGLLAAASFSVSLWNLFQVRIVTQYPQVMKVASFYSLIGTTLCAFVCVLVEGNPTAWKLSFNLELLLIVVTAVFNSIIRSHIHIWCLQKKGPFYVPMFRPVGIVFATVFGVTFFRDTFQYGSVIGTMINGIGYYTIMWGQMKEDEMYEDQREKTLNFSDNKIPLLQGHKV